jgi:hypothetical protein
VQAIEAYILNHLFLSSLYLMYSCSYHATTIPTCVQLEFSYLLQSYKTHIFQNASIFSSKLGLHIVQGLNLTHESHLLVMQDSIPIEWLHACSILFAQCIRFWSGRIKGWSKTRFGPKMNALCVSWLANRILDIGYISSVASSGLVGVKVATII